MKSFIDLKKAGKLPICAIQTTTTDVTIVRLAFVFATILTAVWPGVVTYLVGWYLIPEREHPESPESIKEGV